MVETTRWAIDLVPIVSVSNWTTVKGDRFVYPLWLNPSGRYVMKKLIERQRSGPDAPDTLWNTTEGLRVNNFSPLANLPWTAVRQKRQPRRHLLGLCLRCRHLRILGSSAVLFAVAFLSSAHAQELAHGDWQVRFLQTDGMRLCYAETAPLPGDAGAELGHIRLQATSLSKFAQASVRLSRPPPEVDGITALTVGDTTISLGTLVNNFDVDLPRRETKSLKR